MISIKIERMIRRALIEGRINASIKKVSSKKTINSWAKRMKPRITEGYFFIEET